MIVRTLDDGSLMLVNQTDHAKLSGFFAAHWGNAEFAPPAPRESVVRAAALHDCGWYRYETEPRYDPVAKMSPSFFQVPNDAAQLAAFGWAIDWLTAIDPYAGLLISRHRTGLWRGRYGAMKTQAVNSRGILDAGVAAFAAEYERRQEIAFADIGRAEFDINYQLLQFWDLLSLALCMGEPGERTFEFVPTSRAGAFGEGAAVRMTPAGGQKIRLEPYPFDRRPLTLAFVHRCLPTRKFPSEASFRLAYFAAAPQLKTFTFI